jgi:hypothetical protein
MPQPWEIGEVLTQAWGAFKANWATYLVAALVTIVLTWGPGFTPRIMVAAGGLEMNSFPYFGVSGGSSFLSILLVSFLRPGLIRIYLAAARGQTPVLGDLFSGGPIFLRMLGLQILLSFAYAMGCLLFVVGMVFVTLMFCLADFFLVDAEMDVVAAMKASYEATKGQWGNLFIFGLVAFGLVTAGFAACCVGSSSPLPWRRSRWRSSTRASAVAEP